MMPEGPEVRTVVDQLRAGIGMRFQSLEIISGRYRRNGPPDGYKEFLATLSPLSEISAGKGDVDLIKDWNCKGKFIYVVLDDGGSSKQLAQNGNDFKRSIWITLGMSGRFVSESSNQLQSTDPRWCISLCHHDGKCRKIFYHDPRNFGTLKFSLSAKGTSLT
jgi:formamidopyrimidine-DNA glycosylase